MSLLLPGTYGSFRGSSFVHVSVSLLVVLRSVSGLNVIEARNFRVGGPWEVLSSNFELTMPSDRVNDALHYGIQLMSKLYVFIAEF